MTGLMILIGWVLDVLSLKRASGAIFARYAGPSSPDYPVHRAVWRMLETGRVDGARRLAQARWNFKKSLRIGRDLIHVLLRQKACQEAFQVASDMASLDPGQPWTVILAADIRRFFLGDEDGALSMYIDALPACEAAMPDIYPQAVLLKRLTSIYKRRGDEERWAEAMEKFYSLAPTNFHDGEFIQLAGLRAKRGDAAGAKEVLLTACKTMPRNAAVREAYGRMGFGDPPLLRGTGTPVGPAAGDGEAAGTAEGAEAAVIAGATAGPGASRTAVKTALLTEVDDPVQTVLTYAQGKARAGDIVALSSCVAALMEGRMLMEGTVRPSFLARALSRAIAGEHRTGPFDASAPMANPLSAQTALEEIGTLGVVVATLAGALGKAFGADGWFYLVAGPQVAQIDDILGSVPPYDYYVLMGPRDPAALSCRIGAALGEGVKAAIVDANDLGIAWVVGHSDGVDAKALEAAMSDNPAGNQDQMTPLVIVRPAASPELAADSRPAQALRPNIPRRAVAIAVVLTILGGSAWAWASAHPHTSDVQVPVLLYHEVGSLVNNGNGLDVPTEEFDAQMSLLRAHGYSSITTGALRDYLDGKGLLPAKPVLITFDDGYESVYTHAYPALRENGIKATVFVVGGTLNAPNHLTFEQLREMVASGLVEVGWHTYAGHSGTSDKPDIAGWTTDQFRADFRKIAGVFGEARVPVVPAFSYPFGKATDAEEKTAREWGFGIAFTTEDGIVCRKDSPMLLKRLTVWPGADAKQFLDRLSPSSESTKVAP